MGTDPTSPPRPPSPRGYAALLPWLALIALAVACAALLFGAERERAATYLLPLAVAGVAYPFAVRLAPRRAAFATGLLLRVSAVLAFPLLSDDVYRFLWDGALWWAGLHPLDAVPEALAAGAAGSDGEAFVDAHRGLLAAMNSPRYYTVYPPLAQAVFAAAAALSAKAYGGSVALKAVLLVGELGAYALLRRLGPTRGGPSPATLYWLHPLPIVELVGNAHFEGLALLGLLAALYLLRENPPSGPSVAPARPGVERTRGRLAPPRLIAAGMALGGGALVKLVPLLAAPALGLWALWRNRAALGGGGVDRRALGGFALLAAATTATLALGFAGFFAGADVRGFGASLDLYFRSFEFNGSLYVLARAAGEAYRGWNWIAVVGPSLAVAGALAVLAISAARAWRGLDLAETLLWCFAAYLACATTVHPWYFTYLVGLGALTRYRWPLVLGFAGFLSYLAYGTPDTQVPSWATALEYGPVIALAVAEARTGRDVLGARVRRWTPRRAS